MQSRLVWPGVAPKRPAAHGCGIEEPSEHAWPSVQSWQPASDARLRDDENRPAGHGAGWDAPSLQYAPPLHCLHAVAPSASWYEPAPHGVQRAVASLSAKLPGRHFSDVVAPAMLAWPTGAAVQSASLVARVRLLW